MDLKNKNNLTFPHNENRSTKKKTGLIQEMHQQHLRVTFTTITRPRTLSRFAHLDSDEIRNDVARTFIQPRTHLAHIMLLRFFSQRHEAKRFRIQRISNAIRGVGRSLPDPTVIPSQMTRRSFRFSSSFIWASKSIVRHSETSPSV